MYFTVFILVFLRISAFFSLHHSSFCVLLSRLWWRDKGYENKKAYNRDNRVDEANFKSNCEADDTFKVTH